MSNNIEVKLFGKTKEGLDANCYVLTNKYNMQVEILNYGATIKSIKVPCTKLDNLVDVALGFDDLESYENDGCYIGSTVGRVANRIKRGKFKINNEDYQVSVNNGDNHLHGGFDGFNRKIWNCTIINEYSLKMSYRSVDGEEGYSGNLDVDVVFSLSDDNELSICYTATTDKDTLVNLTNHTYFNLDGNGTTEKHLLQINSKQITLGDEDGIPTGYLMNVLDTHLDFTKEKEIGLHVDSNCNEIKERGGFDHNYILEYDGNINLVSEAKSLETGIKMGTLTNQRGMQLYTGNYLSGTGKNGETYKKLSGFCLETQNFPNAINIPNFFSGILKKDEIYDHKTIYKFDNI